MSYPALFVGEPLGVLELSGERHLDLGELRDLGLSFFELAKKVGVLNGELLLSGVKVIESAVGFISLVLHLVELVLQLFDDLFLTSLSNNIILSSCIDYSAIYCELMHLFILSYVDVNLLYHYEKFRTAT